MARLLSFSDLPALIPQYNDRMGAQAGQNIMQGMIEGARRRQQAQQAQQQLQLEQSIAAERAKHNTASLAEESRHNQAIEGNAVAAREAELVQRQAAEVRALEDEVRRSGGNPEVIRAAQARLQLLGLGANELPTRLSGEELDAMDAAAGSGTSVPPGGAAGPGAGIGHGAREESLAELQARDNRTGNFSLRRLSDGIEMGNIDAPAIRQSQLDPRTLGRIGEMGSSITQPAYREAAAAYADVPYENPADRMRDVTRAAEAEARNATSMVNAAAQRQAFAARAGGSMDFRQEQFAYNVWDKERKDVANMHNARAIQQKIMDARRVTQLVEMAKSQDETGLMASNAIGQLVKATAGARYSDADLRLFTSAFGEPDKWEQSVNNFVKSGQRTELQMRALQRMGEHAELQGIEELEVVGEKVYNQIISNDTLARIWPLERLQRQAEHARRAVEGGAPDPAEGSPVQAGGGGGSSVSTSTSSSGILAIEDDTWGPPIPSSE